jgi:hypothetical protein
VFGLSFRQSDISSAQERKPDGARLKFLSVSRTPIKVTPLLSTVTLTCWTKFQIFASGRHDNGFLLDQHSVAVIFVAGVSIGMVHFNLHFLPVFRMLSGRSEKSGYVLYLVDTAGVGIQLPLIKETCDASISFIYVRIARSWLRACGCT